MKWAGNITRMDAMRIEYRVLEGKREGKGPKHGWEDNIETCFKEMGWRVPTGLI
jgi:hypothetical protein